MSLSAIALTALLAAQPLTSGAPPLGELHLRAPKVGSQAVKAKRPPITWTRDSAQARKALSAFARRDFVLNPMGANCESVLRKARDSGTTEIQPLSKMPSAHLEFAVARLVDGCPVAALMRADDKIR